MHAAKTISITGSIERRSRSAVQKAHGDDTKGYGAQHLEPEIVGQRFTLCAHPKRILKLDRLRLRGPNGARDEFLLAATAQNLRKLAKLSQCRSQNRPERRSACPAICGRLRRRRTS
jgi:hypothetical protein